MLRIRHVLIGAALLLVAGIGFALGQAGRYQITAPSGSELVDVTGIAPNGQLSPLSNYVLLHQLINGTGLQASSATTGTITTTTNTGNLLLTGAVTTATVDVPPSPFNGETFSLTNASGTTFSGTITVAATDGSSFVPASPSISDLAASTGQEWQYSAATTTWYRIR